MSDFSHNPDEPGICPGTRTFAQLAVLVTLAAWSLFGQAIVSWPGDVRVQAVEKEFIFSGPPFRECHASSIVELTGGRLMAAWFGGSHEGHSDVVIWIAEKQSGRWSKPAIVAEGSAEGKHRYPCWNPVLFKSREGTLFLFYKVGPSPQSWQGMMKTSPDDGTTWSIPVKLPEGFLAADKNKPVQLNDGTILCPSSVESGESWRVHLEATSDQGRTWRKISLASQEPFGLIQPCILIYPGERMQLLCRSRQDAIVEAWSEDGGKTWGPFAKTSLQNPNSGIDATTLRNGLQALVYNPDRKGRHWSEGRNILCVAVSADGKSWKDVHTLENETSGEFSYPAIIQARDGRIHVTYTWNRKNIRHVVLEIEEVKPVHGARDYK